MSILTTNGEKMALNINVKIENSDCLRGLSYSSDTEILFITFNNGLSDGGTYQHPDVTVAEMLDFVAIAIDKNSWGKAYHAWKKTRTEYYSEKLQEKTDAFVDGLHPGDRRRIQASIIKALERRYGP